MPLPVQHLGARRLHRAQGNAGHAHVGAVLGGQVARRAADATADVQDTHPPPTDTDRFLQQGVGAAEKQQLVYHIDLRLLAALVAGAAVDAVKAVMHVFAPDALPQLRLQVVEARHTGLDGFAPGSGAVRGRGGGQSDGAHFALTLGTSLSIARSLPPQQQHQQEQAEDAEAEGVRSALHSATRRRDGVGRRGSSDSAV
eukprot:ctg_302.g132